MALSFSRTDETNVCITMSGTNALLDIRASRPGDEVLIPEPYFPLYPPVW